MKRPNPISRTVLNRMNRKSIKWIIVPVVMACMLAGALLKSPRVAASGPVTFAAHNDFATGSIPVAVATGDFNGDGKMDLATANEIASTVSIMLGTGTGTFGAKTDFATG